MGGTRKLERFEAEKLGLLPDELEFAQLQGEVHRAVIEDSAPEPEPPPAPRPEPMVDANAVTVAGVPAPAVERARPKDTPPKHAVALKTRVARKITTLADEVNECFLEYRIGDGDWSVALTAPQMSTGGGKQASQHLRMRPRKPNFPVLVAGKVDPIGQKAELRDYDHMERIHKLRFDQPFPISKGAWEQLLEKLEVVLKLANIKSVRMPPGKELLAETGEVGVTRLIPIVIGVVALLAAGLIVWRVAVALFG